MSEDKLQAAKLLEQCKDEAAKEFGFHDFKTFLYETTLSTELEARVNDVVNEICKLHSAQCVTDERERIKNAMPGIAYDIESCYNSICREQSDNGEWIDRYRLSQLIERGENAK